MKLKDITGEVKVRKGASDKVRPTMPHANPRHKSRAASKRKWKKEVRRDVY